MFADCKLQVEEKLESGHFMSPKVPAFYAVNGPIKRHYIDLTVLVPLQCICVSSNGSLVATGGADGQVIVRCVSTVSVRVCVPVFALISPVTTGAVLTETRTP